jgi:hypothetical protein
VKPGCHLVILSPKGELEFYRNLVVQCIDFRPHKIGEKTFYSYAEFDEFINLVGYLGPRVILDESFTPLKKVAPENDHHEFHLLSPEHWIGFEVRLGRLESGKPYIDKRVVERKEGKVIFDWGVSDYMKQFRSELSLHASLTKFRGEVVTEIHHMNRIQRVGETGFLVGMGHDGVAFVNRSDKKVTWMLGGINDSFSLDMSEHPQFNHAAQFIPDKNQVYIFSNRHWGRIGTAHARVLRYDLDLEKKKLLKFTRLRDKKEMSYLMGSLELTENILSIGLGTREIANEDFVEMNEKGEELWSLSLEKGWTVYRFYRDPWK